MLKHVIRNLTHDDMYYTKCILMANMCKTTKSSAVYTCMASLTTEHPVYR